MENIKVNRCKYCMCEIPEGKFCCRNCFEDFENWKSANEVFGGK